MARNIEAFKERIEIEVANAKANAALQQTERQVSKLTGAWKAGLGLFNKDAAESIEKVERLGGSFTSLAGGPAGMALGALTSIGAAVGGLGIALFRLADQSAEAGDKIFELSEKSGFSASTISAFKLAAESAGSTVEEFSSGLSKFNINMAAAAEGDEKLAKAFARMGVDIKQGLQNPEAALAQFMKRFAELPTNQQRVIAASEIFGKKFGATLVGTFNQAGGNLEDFMRRMKELGIVIDDESAQASNEFEDMKKQFELQFGAMTRTIGFETLPAFMTLFVEVDKGLAGNRENWKQWGKEIAGVMLTAQSIVTGFWRTLKGLSWEDLLPVTGLVHLTYKFWQEFKGAARQAVDNYETLSGNTTGGDLSAGFMNRRKGLDLGEDSTGKSTARMAKSVGAALDPLRKLRDIVEHTGRAVEFYGDKSEVAKVQQELLAAGLNTFTGKLKEQADELAKTALARAMEVDWQKKYTEEQQAAAAAAAEDDRRIAEFGAHLKEQLESLHPVQLTATDELNRFIASEKAAGFAVDETTKSIWAQRASAIDLNQAWQSLFATTDRLDKDAGDFTGPDKWAKARGQINEAAAAAATKGWKVLPSDETRPKWAEFFQMGLTDALNGINGMFSQQQSKKQSLFSKILGFSSPFLSFIPGVGPLLSMAAGAASSALAGDFGGAVSGVAGGIRGGALNIHRPSSGAPGHSDAPSHANGLSFVPHNNYRANLHYGEGVVTAAANLNRGSSGGLDPELIERLVSALERIQITKPGDVFTAGAHKLPEVLSRDATLTRKTQRGLGLV